METREDRLSSLRMLSSLSRHASSRAIAIRATIFVKLRKNRYFHSPRLEIISIQLSRLYQLSSLDSTRTQNKIFSLLKIEFLETGGNDLPFPRERSVRGPFDRPPIAPDDDVAQRFPTTSHG